MILNNYRGWIKMCNENEAKYTDQSATVNLKNLDGNTITEIGTGSSTSYIFAAYTRVFCLTDLMDVYVGSSDAEGLPTDYDLKERLTSEDGITISNIVCNITYDSEKIRRVITFNVSSTANNIIIKEVGIGKTIYLAHSTNTDRFLFARIILDKSVSLNSGESATITIEWSES